LFLGILYSSQVNIIGSKQ